MRMNTLLVERRRHPRKTVDVAATLVGSDGLTRLPVTIRDASDHGARLELETNVPLPTDFYLLVPTHHLQPCRLAWQAGALAGVSYLEA